ncbi:hypothetical protein P9D42_01660 [Bacillus haynesii]|nr:hypothetical protein [Bacillus haynesii]MEC1504368.1 hypothetical protein [Bacillus haynesii]
MGLQRLRVIRGKAKIRAVKDAESVTYRDLNCVFVSYGSGF